MRLDLLSQVSLSGKADTANEDRAGATGHVAWVIDGATDLGPLGLMGPQSGSAWLAETAAGLFASGRDVPLAGLVEQVFAGLAARFETDQHRTPVGVWEHPSAAFLALAATDDGVDLAWLADCSCLHIAADAVGRLGPMPLHQETVLARTALAVDPRMLESRAGTTLALLRAQRAAPERRALGVVARDAAFVQSARIAAEIGDEFVLMTDGFAALIDDYGVPVEDFIDRLHHEGLAALAVTLRQVEAQDGSGKRFPRFKRSDDATALWIRLAPTETMR